MRRCEDEKMRDRPPLLEEPCAQTLSGKTTNRKARHTYPSQKCVSQQTQENTNRHKKGAQHQTTNGSLQNDGGPPPFVEGGLKVGLKGDFRGGLRGPPSPPSPAKV